jgi:predicted enzyme related to lactoylglutathione lyase
MNDLSYFPIPCDDVERAKRFHVDPEGNARTR